MKYIDEFRQRELAQGILSRIRVISRREVNIMEICGSHTHTISRYGIRSALPSNIRLISGPGCPVCVTSGGDISTIINFIRKRRDIILATFGDMMRVPGADTSLQDEKAAGSDVRVIYSPSDVIEIAKKNPEREVVFFAVGFETTVPTVAATIIMAEREGIRNLTFYTRHKLTPPAMKALLDSGEIKLHGFICPGHVTAVIGAESYRFIATNYVAPCVVAGFEPIDVLQGLYMLVRQLEAGTNDIEIQYSRVVTWEGNTKAQGIIDRVFESADASWRGIGTIPVSGLGIKELYSAYDAEKRFVIERAEDREPPGCSCGEILKGMMSPNDCPLFGKACTPETPKGPCMVSYEGTCSAYYKYGIR